MFVRHGVDVSEREAIWWDADEAAPLTAEILAEAENLTYSHPVIYERENVLGLPQRYGEEHRDALLQAIRELPA